MYYVLKMGEQDLTYYHARFHDQAPARAYAENLKTYLSHDYDVVRVETVYTTGITETTKRG